jgi:rhamnosyltransferase
MKFEKPAKNTIGAVFVTFNVDLGFPERVHLVVDQVDSVIIVDNGSHEAVRFMLHELEKNEKICVVYITENLGIAAALNRGLGVAKEKGYPWVMTFDHDSTAEKFMVDTYIEIFDQIEDKEKIAIIGCNHIDTKIFTYLVDPGRYKGRRWMERKEVISSGCLLSMKIFDALGPFREDFFIDVVDTEYCFRARKNHYKVIFVLEPLLRHSIGNKLIIRPRWFPWIRITTANYAVFRRYFWTRNNLILIRDYFFIEPSWTLLRFSVLIVSNLKALIFEEDRAEKLQMIAFGYLDFFTGKMDRRVLPENGEKNESSSTYNPAQ